MTLIIEDGSIVPGANSYVDVAYVAAYASVFGEDFTSDVAMAETYILRAMNKVETYRNDFKGKKVSIAQSLQWPRSGAQIDGFDFPSTSIPLDLKQATAEFAVKSQTVDLTPDITTAAVTKEKVDTIEVQYDSKYKFDDSLRFTKAENFLEPLLQSDNAYGQLLRPVRA